jgi:sugar (pentulose or hexulose) kinase
MMNLVRGKWSPGMLEALADPEHRKLVRKQLPTIVPQDQPLGPLSANLAIEAGMPLEHRPLIFPTSDDQQAGLVGGGAVDSGHMAIILGNSAVVNSSSMKRPLTGNLDVMRLNWGPFLWMRCYNNGAQFVDRMVGPRPDWKKLESLAAAVPAGSNGIRVLPFEHPEPSVKVTRPRLEWSPREPSDAGVRYRAALEALAYLIALGVRQHERAGQQIDRISVSGGMARSDLMCRILASVLNRRLERLLSEEGPALGAAVTALAAYESYRRKENGIDAAFTAADGVDVLVKFRKPVEPTEEWVAPYKGGLQAFEKDLHSARKS